MKQPKIIFFDIDGTLTSSITGDIPQSAIDAIAQLKAQGIHVIAATGRPYSMCGALKDFGFDTFITANGAYVRQYDNVLYSANVDTEFQRQVMTLAETNGHAMTFYCEDFFYNGLDTPQLAYALHDAFMLDATPKRLPSPMYPTNLMCLIATEDQMTPYIDAFQDVTFQRWHETIVTVLTEPVSKSRAIAEVLKAYHCTPEEAMAFGDGYNDMDMLAYVGFGVAMGNAPDVVKAHAEYVTVPAHDGGIMHALQHLGVITSNLSFIDGQ